MSNSTENTDQNQTTDNSKPDFASAFKISKKLVIETKEIGSHLETWVETSLKECKPFLREYAGEQLYRVKHYNTPTFEKAFRDAVYWENEISFRIRDYFSAISDILTRLNQLTPPLEFNHVRPTLEQILSLRREAMNSIDKLKLILDHAEKIKQHRFSFNSPNDTLTFQP